jgi:hypothetical protein
MVYIDFEADYEALDEPARQARAAHEKEFARRLAVLPKEDIDDLAAIAKISAERRAEFDNMIRFWLVYGANVSPYVPEEETTAEYDARMFLHKMASGYDRLTCGQQSQMRDVGITPEMIFAVKEELKGRQRLSRRLARTRSEESPFEHFLVMLFVIVGSHGGSLSLDRKNQSGTLVRFLRTAEKHLPKGFMPGALPFRSMETIKSRWGRKREPTPR